MVKFFDFTGQPDYEKFRRGLITDAKDIISTALIWNVLYQTYFLEQKNFLFSRFFDAPETAGDHSFPAIYYYYAAATPSHEAKFELALLVEAMDMNDADLNWDAEASYAYQYFNNLNEDSPSHRSYGVISAGTNFVLFEVIGKETPKYLIGNATSPASFLYDGTREQVEVEVEKIKKAAESGFCKFLPDIKKAPTGL